MCSTPARIYAAHAPRRSLDNRSILEANTGKSAAQGDYTYVLKELTQCDLVEVTGQGLKGIQYRYLAGLKVVACTSNVLSFATPYPLSAFTPPRHLAWQRSAWHRAAVMHTTHHAPVNRQKLGYVQHCRDSFAAHGAQGPSKAANPWMLAPRCIGRTAAARLHAPWRRLRWRCHSLGGSAPPPSLRPVRSLLHSLHRGTMV